MDKLITETETFKQTCSGIFSEFTKELEKTIIEKIKTDVTLNSTKIINGANMYDYQTDEIEFLVYQFNKKTRKYEIIEESCSDFLTRIINLNEKFNLENEKVIIGMSHEIISSNVERIQTMRYLIITNKATVFIFELDNDKGNISIDNLFEHKRFDFLIPKDYYNILHHFLYFEEEYENDTKFGNMLTRSEFESDYITIMLKIMKEELYNRKYMPLYVIDIIKENEELKSKYKEFEEKSKEFEEKTRPYINILEKEEEIKKDRDDIIQEKEKLKKMTMKLKLEQEKLIQDKKNLENDKLTFDKIKSDTLGEFA